MSRGTARREKGSQDLRETNMKMKRLLFAFGVAACALVAPIAAVGDNGNASPTLSFFSGGNGAHADWLVTADQPPGDTDSQAIRLLTTDGAPTFEHGYAGILVHHVT